MSSLVLDLRSAEEPRDVIHRAVQALAEGKIVGFPTETVYVLAASGLNQPAIEKLHRLIASHDPLSAGPAAANGSAGATNGSKSEATPYGRRLMVAVKSRADALDYVPDLSRLGQRLARRCWPGPITLWVDQRHPDSLIGQLAGGVRQRIAPDKVVGVRVPAHEVLQDVLRLTVGPIVIGDCPRRDGHEAVNAAEVVEGFDNEVSLVVDVGPTRFRQRATSIRVYDSHFEIVQPGVVSEQNLKRLSSMLVLFVCTGNTCRSPMAEGIFRQLVADRLGCKADEVEDRGIRVMSAGLAAMMGGPAAREAVAVLAESGIDLKNHESQPVTEMLVRHADLILTMTRSHRNALLAEWPDAADRTKLVNRSGADVVDPIGGSPEVYRQCAGKLRGELEAWVNEIPLS